MTAVRPVILASAVEYSSESESTTLGIIFTVLDGVGMFGALLAGMIAEWQVGYAFLMASGLALLAALMCLPLSMSAKAATEDQLASVDAAAPASPVNPADP